MANPFGILISEVEDATFAKWFASKSGWNVEVVECGAWIDEDKSQTCRLILGIDGDFYEATAWRTGNHWSGYTYMSELDEDGEETLTKVYRKEVVTYEWVAV